MPIDAAVLKKLADEHATAVGYTPGTPAHCSAAGKYYLEGKAHIEAYEAARQPKPRNALGFDIPQTLDDLTAKAAAPGQGDMLPQEFLVGHDKKDPAWILCDRLTFLAKNTLALTCERLIAGVEAYEALLQLRKRTPAPQPALPALSGEERWRVIQDIAKAIQNSPREKQIMVQEQAMGSDGEIVEEREVIKFVQTDELRAQNALAALELRYNLTPKGHV